MGVNRWNGGGSGGVRRLGVSGPWVDSHGNPAAAPYSSSAPPPPPPAELKRPKEKKLPNPDPYNFVVQDAEQVGPWLVLKVKYPDCVNFEGVKILVFADTTPIDLLKQGKFLDPHFFENQSKVRSPVARFVPTQHGWEMAVRFARMMTEGKPGG